MDISSLNESLDYNAETGVFTWKHRQTKSPHDKTYNAQFAGKVAGTKANTGYILIAHKGKRLLAHRVAWAMQFGAPPSGEIDHINGDRDDNRIVNLRDVPKSVNAKNKRRLASNSSGVNGVSQIKTSGRWRAYIKIFGKQIWLGAFATREEADRARSSANNAYGFHINHGEYRDQL